MLNALFIAMMVVNNRSGCLVPSVCCADFTTRCRILHLAAVQPAYQTVPHYVQYALYSAAVQMIQVLLWSCQLKLLEEEEILFSLPHNLN